jgi:hypothetical protein
MISGRKNGELANQDPDPGTVTPPAQPGAGPSSAKED